MPDISSIYSQVENTVISCFRCGVCRTVCPSFKIHGLESASPRGRIQFVRAVGENRTAPDEILKDKIFDCLGCMSCAGTCPAGVNTDRIMLSMRAGFAADSMFAPMMEEVIGKIMQSPTLTDFFSRITRTGQMLTGGNGFAASLIPRLTGLGDRKFPKISPKTALNCLPYKIEAQGKKKGRAGFFIGCASNFLYPGTAVSIANVLSMHGFEIIVPPKQVCCGIPVYSRGLFKTASGLAKKNLEVFGSESLDMIVTGCPSCASALKNKANELLGTGSFDVPVYDSMELLCSLDENKSDYGRLDMKITFHDPCHMTRGLGLKLEPRKIAVSIPGVEIKEMRDPESCCGGAGTFAFTHRETSLEVGKGKAAALKESGAENVCTSCPSCRMQIEYLLAREGIRMEVIHPLELIERAGRKK